MVKVTYTLDEATVDRVNRVAERLKIPKSQVVREAIKDYHSKGDRMPEEERLRKVKFLREYMAQPPTSRQADVDRELAEIRHSRRTGWQRPSDRR